MRWFLPTLMLAFLAGVLFGQTDTLLYESFEDGMTWEVGDLYWYGDTAKYWHKSDFLSYDGISYWCGTHDVGGTGYSGYNDGWLQYLDMPEVSIPLTASEASLSFLHRLNTEEPGPSGWPYGYDGWDGAAVWYSLDGGTTWSTLTPDAPYAYDVSSLWAFGFCNLGPGYPAWTGIHGPTDFVPVEADLADFAGQNIIIRFVFSSDMMYSTGPTNGDAFDSDMFGWIVDEIRIEADGVELLYDTGDGHPVASQGRELRTWTIDDTDANTGTKSAVAYNYSETYSTITSPVISIPDTFNGRLSFYVKTNCVDYDPDGDGMLDDYMVVYVYNITDDTLVQMSHNYYRPGYIDETWRHYNDAVLYDVSYGMRNSLLEFAGKDIQLMIMARGDGQPNPDQWFKIDDVAIVGNYAPMHDIAPTDIVSGPLNVGDLGRFTAKISNLGMSGESLIQVTGNITYPDGTDTTVAFFPRPSIEPGNWGTTVTQLNLTQHGTYTIRVWTSLATDMNTSNDTLEMEFFVYPPSTRELGWDVGMNDIASNPETGVSYNGFLGASMTAGDALGNFFYQTAGLRDIELTHVKFFTRFNGPVRITVLENGFFDIPNGGTELYRENHDVTSEPEVGSWVTIDLSDDPITIPDTTFFVFVGVAVDSQMPVIGIDNTSPVHRKGFAIITYFDDFGMPIVTDTFDLASASPPLNNIDLMIRAIVTGTHTGIDGDGTELPKELALKGNFPNPFNPATAIEFDIPEHQKATLEIYNVLGERVTTLVDDDLKPGTYRATWEGRDDLGRELPSGVYLYRLSAGDKSISRRMILIK